MTPPPPRRLQALAFLVCSLLLQTAAGLLGKMAALRIESNGMLEVAFNPFTLASLACMGVQAVVWPLALRGIPLSTAYSFTSIQIVNTLLVSRFFFGEQVSPANVAGAVLIMAGIVTLGFGYQRAGHD